MGLWMTDVYFMTFMTDSASLVQSKISKVTPFHDHITVNYMSHIMFQIGISVCG